MRVGLAAVGINAADNKEFSFNVKTEVASKKGKIKKKENKTFEQCFRAWVCLERYNAILLSGHTVKGKAIKSKRYITF